MELLSNVYQDGERGCRNRQPDGEWLCQWNVVRNRFKDYIELLISHLGALDVRISSANFDEFRPPFQRSLPAGRQRLRVRILWSGSRKHIEMHRRYILGVQAADDPGHPRSLAIERFRELNGGKDAIRYIPNLRPGRRIFGIRVRCSSANGRSSPRPPDSSRPRATWTRRIRVAKG